MLLLVPWWYYSSSPNFLFVFRYLQPEDFSHEMTVFMAACRFTSAVPHTSDETSDLFAQGPNSKTRSTQVYQVIYLSLFMVRIRPNSCSVPPKAMNFLACTAFPHCCMMTLTHTTRETGHSLITHCRSVAVQWKTVSWNHLPVVLSGYEDGNSNPFHMASDLTAESPLQHQKVGLHL